MAAAAVIFVAGGGGGWSLRPLSVPQWQTEARPLAQEAADSYRAFEPDHIHPIEVGADKRDDLVNWVSSRLQRRVSAPEFANGYRLMGGRVVPTSRGPAGMLMYDKDGTRVVMLICPLSVHGAAPMTESVEDKLATVSWSEHGMGYSLVGETSSDELRPIAETIRRLISDKA
jgi:anti-sigma factor RsiW